MTESKTLNTLLTWLNDTRFDLGKRRDEPYFDEQFEDDKPRYRVVRTPIRMNDGTLASLQYSHGHYCHGTNLVPRSMEIWHCLHHDCLGKSDEDHKDPYAYVPLMSILEYIDAHGGIMDLNVQLALNVLDRTT